MTVRDHIDLGMRVLADGGSIWLEPAVVVDYLWPKPLTLRDSVFYSRCWSEEWIERSHASFNARWQITVPQLDDEQRDAYRKRRLHRAPWPPGWRTARRGPRIRVRCPVRPFRYTTLRALLRPSARSSPADPSRARRDVGRNRCCVWRMRPRFVDHRAALAREGLSRRPSPKGLQAEPSQDGDR